MDEYKEHQSNNVELAFNEAIASFESLNKVNICLDHNEIPSSSMRAQPVVNLRFFSKAKRQYKIEVAIQSKIDGKTKMEDIPKNILIGWIAHELGHVCDYQNRSTLGMIIFGLGYILSPSFKKKAEQRADKFAIANGFGRSIIETKKFMLSHADLGSDYRQQLEKYYYSPEDIEELVAECQNTN